jgi:DNA-binding NtrC family response regulator
MMSTVLVIDNDPGSQESIKAILGEEHMVLVSSNERQALEILNDNKVDLALLDVSGSPDNRLAFLKKIQETHPVTEIIMLAASSEAQVVREAVESGALDYILKPFHVSKLRFVVSRAFRIIALKSELENLRTSGMNVVESEELVGNKSLREATEELEKQMIEEALEKTGHVHTRASRLLKTTRRILRYKMKILGIE